jgi:hypothetical protein
MPIQTKYHSSAYHPSELHNRYIMPPWLISLDCINPNQFHVKQSRYANLVICNHHHGLIIHMYFIKSGFINDYSLILLLRGYYYLTYFPVIYYYLIMKMGLCCLLYYFNPIFIIIIYCNGFLICFFLICVSYYV